MKKQTSLIKYGGKVMFNTVSLDDMIRNSIREKDWSKLTVDKTVETINNMPEFMLHRRASLVIDVSLEDGSKSSILKDILPEVVRGVQEDKLHTIIKDLVTEDRLFRKFNVRNKVITSFGWGIEELIQLIGEDYGLMGKVCKIINDVADELKEDEYSLIVINQVRGTLSRVGNIMVSDLLNENVRVDIVHENKITHSNYTK